MLKHGILGLLNYGSMTGYEIMEIFRDSLNYFWSANTSQIYRELGMLKEKDYATVTVIHQDGKPDKNVFSITDKGKEELIRWLQISNYEKPNIKICMKTFFSGELSVNENIEKFNKMLSEYKNNLKKFEVIYRIYNEYKYKISNQEISKYWEMTIDYGVRYLKMLIEWTENNIKLLEESK